MNTNRRYKLDSNYHWARYHLNRGLASCTFWWASGKRLTMWQERSWSPDEIERGIEELIKSVRALEDATTRVTKVKAEKLYIGIKQLIWSNHWTDYWKK